ncbi:MAG TPA: Stp1/IreP family PP2C-type Ser/Thr phosphatase [Myxococcota bacterium]|nr:Stp1/IreP family PP2C-type Ser/Thr phosphatase [Myxococcota bacterium]HOA13159.1 Stp1/IreP family PP2C-type Ser/Thr phosphatase [Myxococcota bacterium]HOC99541.1 Stp1/IreP family PP2C-type Ser/Thr phosphatase [Myxococcota bacterium]HOH76314.1 Stp1/IreP family PP2C-type Ser/Thr phosphatase [Myxococcota bacterium]HPV02943.1 Stp1/IreP family PP2C-type Ser/Thr phosphatase [Myxococcota bacterium]
MELRYAGLTDVGRKRDHNEDNFLVVPENNLFVVCDGMGGHACGEVASQIAVEEIAYFFRQSSGDAEATWPYRPDGRISMAENRLVAGIKWANFKVFETASGSGEKKGMGTTCVAFHVDGDKISVAHVGDSRAYRIRDGRIEQLTTDHSLLEQYKQLAKISDEEIKNFPYKNIIVRALGMKETVVVDTRLEDFRPGDCYLLCCDGLSGELDDEEILDTCNEFRDDLDRCCSELIGRANTKGGRDNITVVLVKGD